MIQVFHMFQVKQFTILFLFSAVLLAASVISYGFFLDKGARQIQMGELSAEKDVVLLGIDTETCEAEKGTVGMVNSGEWQNFQLQQVSQKLYSIEFQVKIALTSSDQTVSFYFNDHNQWSDVMAFAQKGLQVTVNNSQRPEFILTYN